MSEVLEKLDFIAKQTKQEVASLLGKAVELGVHQLWVQTILDSYLRKEITREEAVKAVGPRLVELAERQLSAVLEDVRWGLSGG